jgi:hypothetical protein
VIGSSTPTGWQYNSQGFHPWLLYCHPVGVEEPITTYVRTPARHSVPGEHPIKKFIVYNDKPKSLFRFYRITVFN